MGEVAHLAAAVLGRHLDAHQAVLAEGAAQRADRGVGDVGDGAQPEAVQFLLGALTDSPQGGDRQLLDEADDLVDGLAQGAGVVADSDPDAETAETVTKATAPLRSVLTAGEMGRA